MMKRRNIIGESYSKKIQVYEEIDRRYHTGQLVKLKEHKTGFPAVTLDCGNLHILTDILSMERWWPQRETLKQEGHQSQ
jgi:hypothetical protein